LHHEEVLALLFADVVKLDDIMMMKRRREPRFIEEHLHVVLVVRLLRTDPLDDDVALESFDPGRTREEHLGHATLRQVLYDLITPQRDSRIQHMTDYRFDVAVKMRSGQAKRTSIAIGTTVVGPTSRSASQGCSKRVCVFVLVPVAVLWRSGQT